MFKKISAIFLAFVLLFTLCTAVFADTENLTSPVMKKGYASLKAEISGFINSARTVIARDDGASKLPQTQKLEEQMLQARQILSSYKNAPETMQNIIVLENYLLDLFGGWDENRKNTDGTFGAYTDANRPFSPAQNAMYIRTYALDNYLARDPVYGYYKLLPVIGEVTRKDTENNDALVRVEVKDSGFLPNPGQYTYDSWYNFAKKVWELTRMMECVPEFNNLPEITQNHVTRTYMERKLQEYRNAYDALELTASETDPALTEEQKENARQRNRLQSIIRMMLEIWPEDAVEKEYYFNNLAHKFDFDKLYALRDGSTTPQKVAWANQWLADYELSYRLDLSTDDTQKEELRAWIADATAASVSADITVEELLQYVSLGERYADGAGVSHYVDDAEDPAKIRAEHETWVCEYLLIRNTMIEKFTHSCMYGQTYRNAKNAILYQAEADRVMHRYDSAEAKVAYDAFIKSHELGDSLLAITNRYVSESEFWTALENIMTAYEKLLPLRSNEAAHELIYKQIKAFMEEAANKPLYTEESWAALETAVADYEAQREIYNGIAESMNVTDAESAERLALAVDKINVKAYAMNEKYLTLELADVKVSNASVLNAAREILKKTELAYNFLDGSDMPYTAAAFERFKTAYAALKNAVDVLEKELTAESLKLTYGDKDILAMIIELITAQTGLVYCPDTCND